MSGRCMAKSIIYENGKILYVARLAIHSLNLDLFSWQYKNTIFVKHELKEVLKYGGKKLGPFLILPVHRPRQKP